MIRTIDIRSLRERTGAAVMECKQALEQFGGDVEAAAVLLKERGRAMARKREDRETHAGRLFLRLDGGRGALVKLLTETDFVAMNREFLTLGQRVAELAVRPGDRRPGGDEASGLVEEAMARIRERIVLASVRTIEAADGELLRGYLHPDGTLAAIVRLRPAAPDQAAGGAALRELADDLALHVAARGPAFIERSGVPESCLAEWRTGFQAEAEALGKPAQLVAKIVEGRLAKRLGSLCLLEQPYVRDEERSVAEVLAARAGASGLPVAVTGFLYDSVRDLDASPAPAG